MSPPVRRQGYESTKMYLTREVMRQGRQRTFKLLTAAFVTNICVELSLRVLDRLESDLTQWDLGRVSTEPGELPGYSVAVERRCGVWRNVWTEGNKQRAFAAIAGRVECQCSKTGSSGLIKLAKQSALMPYGCNIVN